MKRSWRIVLTVLLTSLLSKTVPAAGVVYLEEFLSGFNEPITVKNAGDGSDRLFVVERDGVIRVVDGGEVLPSPFLDIRDRIDTIGEGGLMGLAFHPGFAANGLFFVCYTASAGGEYRIVVSRFQVSGSSPHQADPEERVVLEIDHQTLIHNGGELVFGRDGSLFISVGDGAFMEELGDLAQDLTSLSGKILRIDADRDPYGIPPDNPFVGHPEAREEIWAYGFRNPFRMSLDRFSGRLFVADVGENRVEEINLVVRGGNYGWRHLEGEECFPPQVQECDREGLQPPVAVYTHVGTRPAAVIGGLVYRGEARTGLWNSYLFSDFVSGQVWALEETSRGKFRRRQVGQLGMLAASWGEDEQGEVLIPGKDTGTLFRLRFAWIENYAQVVSGRFGPLLMTTRFDLQNLAPEPVTGVLRFLSGDGTSEAVRISGLSTSDLPLELGGGESMSLALDPRLNHFQGWALILATGPIASSVHFLQAEGEDGDLLPAASVGPSTWARASRTWVVQDDLQGAGFAIASFWAATGVDVLIAEDQPVAHFDLEAGQQVTFHLGSLPGVPAGYTGPVRILGGEDLAVTAAATVGGLPASGLLVAAEN